MMHPFRTRAVSTLTAMVAALCAAAGSDLGAQRGVTGFVTGSVLDNRVRIGDGAIDRASGTIWGFGGTVRWSEWLGGQISIAGGRLTARSPGGEDRAYSEAALVALITPDRWVVIDAGPVIRVHESAVARQRWTEIRIGTEMSIPLIDPSLRGLVRGSLSPLVSVTGQASPDLSVGAGTGLEFTSGRLVAGLDFQFDRHDFPVRGAGQRLEQRSSLTARVGWRVR